MAMSVDQAWDEESTPTVDVESCAFVEGPFEEIDNATICD
jgi:hypothetical protein